MKRVPSLTALSVLVTLAACSGSDNASSTADASGPPATVAAPFVVKVIGFNDFHGNLESSGTFGQTAAAVDKPVVGGADYYCNIDPRIPLSKLKKGTRVLVNEAFVIVGDLGFEPAGPVTKITEVIGEDRLRVGSTCGHR